MLLQGKHINNRMPLARLVFVSFLNVITHQKGETQWKLCICVFLLNSFNLKGRLLQTHVRLRESAGEWQVAFRSTRGESALRRKLTTPLMWWDRMASAVTRILNASEGLCGTGWVLSVTLRGAFGDCGIPNISHSFSCFLDTKSEVLL